MNEKTTENGIKMGDATINCKGESQEERIELLEDGFKELWAVHEAQQNKIIIQDKRIANLYDEFLALKKAIDVLVERSLDAKYQRKNYE